MNAKIPSQAARLATLTGAALLAAVLAPAPARADTCWIGFRNGSTPSIDGARTGSEWNDASVLDSGAGCLNRLIDNASGTVERTVRVYSKKDATHLYLLFEVGDATNALGAPGTSLGEMIILHLDPNHSRDPILNAGGGDHRYVFSHRWANSGAIQRDHYVSQASTGACVGPVLNEWSSVSTPWPAADVQMQYTLGSDYTVEMRFPLTGAGGLGVTSPLASDIGLAFAIVNDLGAISTLNDPLYSATRFPQSLPFTTSVNAIMSDETSGCSEWLQPEAWGGGYHNQAPGDVTFSHSPVYWQAGSVTAADCADIPGWQYYPAGACKVTVKAVPTVTGGATRRNLLYLWGDHDAGTVRWTFMDLQLGVDMVDGDTVPSALWDAPSGLAQHPCVRVYALPNAFRADFTEAQIRALAQAPHTTIEDMEAKYGLQPIHSAQRNITHLPTAPACPGNRCPSSAMRESSGGRFARSADLISRWFAPTPLFAQDRRNAPRDTLPGRDVKWPGADRERYGRDNVGVQVRTYGYQHPVRRQRVPYQIIEPLGGALQLVPARLLMERQRLPLVFNVTAPNTGRYTVLPVIDQHVPAGMNVRVDLRVRPMEFQNGETQRLEGALAYAGGAPTDTGGQGPTPGGGRGCPIGFGMAGAGLALLGLSRRPRRRA